MTSFVQIDFQGFVQMIDTVGGVMVDVPYPIRDDEYPAENFRYQRIYFPAGWQHPAHYENRPVRPPLCTRLLSGAPAPVWPVLHLCAGVLAWAHLMLPR